MEDNFANQMTLTLKLNSLALTPFSDQLPPSDKYLWIVDIMEATGYEYELTDKELIFKYPDVVCTDLYGNTQNITDLYIRLQLGSRNYDAKKPAFRRMSGTVKQISNRYLHSHLSGDFNSWTTAMCFGNSVDIQRQNFDEALIMLLTTLDMFLKTESSNSNPYVRIATMSDNMRGELTYYSYNHNMIRDNLNLIESVVLIKTDDGYKLDVVFVKNVDEQLVEQDIVSYHMKGKWFSATSNTTTFFETLGVNNDLLSFKGQDVQFKVMDGTDEVRVKLPCGQFKKNIITYINNRFSDANSVQHFFTTFGITQHEDSTESR